MLIERWHSRNVDEVVARLDTEFQGVSAFAAHGGADELQDSLIRLTLGELSVIRHATSGIRFRALVADKLHLAFPTRGGARAKSRKGTTCTSPFVLGNTLPADDAFELDVLPGSVTYVVEVPLATWHAKPRPWSRTLMWATRSLLGSICRASLQPHC